MRLAVLALFAAAGCGSEREASPARPPEPVPEARAAPACEPRRFEGSAFTVCRFDARADRLEIVVDGGAADGRGGVPLRGFAGLERWLGVRAPAVRFAMNAGMFDEAGEAIGLFVADGRERHRINRRTGSGNFHLLPNGVFAQGTDGRVHVVRSDRFAARVPRPRWATQSGPMLVIDGALHPRFDADGPSRLIRNGVGVSDGDTAWFAISEEGVSFGRFARFFRDGLGCRNALFLDGSVSSLWDPATGRRDAFAPLGPMIVVMRGG